MILKTDLRVDILKMIEVNKLKKKREVDQTIELRITVSNL